MAKQIVVRKKPRAWSVGLFVAGVIAVIYYRITDSFNFPMLVICIVVSFVVDKWWYGRKTEPGVYIEE